MINLFFYLQKQKQDKNGLIPVYMNLAFNGQRIRKSVRKVKCKISHWNESKERIKKNLKTEQYNNSDEMNQILEDLNEAVHRINKVSLKYNISLTEDFILEKLENPHAIEILKTEKQVGTLGNPMSNLTRMKLIDSAILLHH